MESAKTIINPDDPRYVPDKKQWEKMTESEKTNKENQIIDALEQESSLMGETTKHFNARASATEVLKRYYLGKGQKVFIASDLHTLYPTEIAFYPDLLVVFNVDDHHRSCWNVHREQKGLDFVLEIVSKSSRRNDRVEKLNLFAHLGIPEYFIYDPEKHSLSGYNLLKDKQYQHYQAIKPNTLGNVFSKILGLNLTIEDFKLRFVSVDGLEVLFGDELIKRLNDKLSTKDQAIADAMEQVEEERKEKEEEKKQKEEEQKQKEEAQKQKEEEQKLRKEEQKRREEAELKIHELEEELKQLKK